MAGTKKPAKKKSPIRKGLYRDRLDKAIDKGKEGGGSSRDKRRKK